MTQIADSLSVFDRLPPHDLDAETCVLGSMMLCGDDRTTFDMIRARCRSDDFYQADNQILFDAIVSMADRAPPVAIDAVTVRAELKRLGTFEDCGGMNFLARILGTVPTAAHGEHYAAIVREKALLRGGIALSNDLLRACYAPAKSAEDAAATIRDCAGQLLELATTGSADKFVRLHEAVDRVLQRKLDGDVRRIKTELYEFDALTGGLPRGKFILVAGRPGMGKSQFCKQVVLNIASGLTPAAVVTIEEDEGKVAENAIANFSGIENRKVAYGNFGMEEWKEVERAAKEIRQIPVWVNDHPSRLSEVEEAITVAAIKHKCPVVVVDYLQLIDPDTPGDNENREITKISKTLKRLAKRLDIALVAACQLNRGNETGGIRLPTLRDLRGSGSLEQDGDLIVLLHRNDYYLTDDDLRAGKESDRQLRTIIAKNKDGPQATIPMCFDARTQRISDWSNARDVFEPRRAVQLTATAPTVQRIVADPTDGMF